VPHGLQAEEVLLRQALGDAAAEILAKGTQIIMDKC